ncbi:MAG: hypothetical protein U9M95_01400 [Candidatus Altiarchaeota archaeon]|nr:hypothetical protein [Candidatus Altiarchaeota archaeon]
MELNININRRHTYMILFVLVLGFASILVFSQGGPIQGHPAEEITPGTFSGGGDYVFPADSNVGIGAASPAGKLDLALNRIVNVGDPVDGKDAVNKDYVDAQAGGGGGFVTVAENNDATFTQSDYDTVDSFIHNEGDIIAMQCHTVGVTAPPVPVTYSTWTDGSVVTASTVRMGSYTCHAGSACNRVAAGQPCTGGWRIIGVKL